MEIGTTKGVVPCVLQTLLLRHMAWVYDPTHIYHQSSHL